MSRDLYPLLIEPKETAAIWGGDALVRTYGKAGDPHATLGESWECWDENRVRNGVYAGQTIAQLRAALGSALLGGVDPAHRFPILTKIIDARAPLSVQVHPDDAYAQRVEGQPNGKTECWYILAADPGAELVLGWTRETTREEYERRVNDGTLGEILRRVPVHPGETYWLPAGTLHAIGAGIQLFETQQASDLTYRIFDWNRVGADGKPRELHVRKAGDVLDFHAATQSTIAPLVYTTPGLRRTLLIASGNFTVERIAVDETARFDCEDAAVAMMSLAKPLRIDDVELAPYTTALLPAGLGAVTLAGEDAVVLATTPPRSLDRVRGRVRDAGVDERAAQSFFAQFAA